MKKDVLHLAICIGILALSSTLQAQPGTAAQGSQQADAEVPIGIIDVYGSARRLSLDTIDSATLQGLNLDTVGVALASRPGVSLTRNSRNEDIISVRGFDSRQVPVYLDGIPLHVSWDGYVDLSRFTTFDLDQINISKSGASLLYGANTLGGAVNLISRKPREAFEGNIRLGSAAGSRRLAAINLGARSQHWYVQSGLSHQERDSFPLADGFADYKQQDTDTGNYRENAYSSDSRLYVKAGYMPNDSDEYAIGYSKQDGEKGNPVYTGTSRQGIRFWQWPYWDKESLYLLGTQTINDDLAVTFRVFQDRYDNRIDAFTNATYSVSTQPALFPSIQREKNSGAAVTLSTQLPANHELQIAMHIKEDRHAEILPRVAQADYRDLTTSFALEDSVILDDSNSARFGVSTERREARDTDIWPTGSADAVNGLAEYSHEFTASTTMTAAISRKTRFPTIKDRYSVRLGQALPNPDLKPETANSAEIGVQVLPWRGATGSAALFYSHIKNLIQTGSVLSNQCGGNSCDQAQNIGTARHRGLELSLGQALGETMNLSLAYTFLDRDNLDAPALPLTGTPEHRVFAYFTWRLWRDVEVLVSAEAESGRLVNFAGSGQSAVRELAGFSVWGAKGIWHPTQRVTVEAGIDNLTDRNYELADGFPMPGRSWFLNLSTEF